MSNKTISIITIVSVVFHVFVSLGLVILFLFSVFYSTKNATLESEVLLLKISHTLENTSATEHLFLEKMDIYETDVEGTTAFNGIIDIAVQSDRTDLYEGEGKFHLSDDKLEKLVEEFMFTLEDDVNFEMDYYEKTDVYPDLTDGYYDIYVYGYLIGYYDNGSFHYELLDE